MKEEEKQTPDQAAFTMEPQQFHAVMDHMRGGVAIFESTGKHRLLYVNSGFFELLGCTSLRSQGLISVMKPYVLPEDMEKAERLLLELKRRGASEEELRIRRENGSQLWLSVRGSRIDYPDAALPVFLFMLTDITSLKASEEALRRRVERDALTGVYNAGAFYEKAVQLLKEKRGPYYMLRFNIERFKVINEVFGRNVGDVILVRMASILSAMVEPEGVFGRIESDDFAACVPAERFDVTRFSQTVFRHQVGRNEYYPVTVKLGIYPVEDAELPVRQMTERAKLAMDTIKGDYLRDYVYYDDVFRRKILEEQAIIAEAGPALSKGQFCVFYQPIYDAVTEEIAYAEALVRWRHPRKGLIAPGSFISLFERNGMISQLDVFVWETVCKLIHDRRKKHLPMVPVSVNVSRKDLLNAGLVQLLSSLVRRYDIGSENLKIEITESAYTDNPYQLMETIGHFKQQGFSILMDDFGSGYSSLNMLKELPVDTLKIDMRFLSDFDSNVRAGSVLTSVVRMAKWLDMKTVAEGVETRQQLAFLRNIGCDYIQGYYLAKPMPEDVFLAALGPGAGQRPRDPDLAPAVDMNALLNPNEEINRVINDMMGAMGILEMDGDDLEILQVNEGYKDLIGNAAVLSSIRTRQQIHPADYPKLLEACREARDQHKVCRLALRRQSSDGGFHWDEVKLRCIGRNGFKSLFYFAVEDVTTRKTVEEDRFLNRYVQIFKGIFRSIYELNFTENAFTLVMADTSVSMPMGQSGDLRHTYDYVTRNLIDPEFTALFRQISDRDYIREKLAHQPSLETELRCRVDGESEYRWVRRILFPIEGALGKEVYLSCHEDIDARKRKEKERS
jgi:diguanylate cyclase (GGDEF)-like protein/PAS domain S-box-containing protein